MQFNNLKYLLWGPFIVLFIALSFGFVLVPRIPMKAHYWNEEGDTSYWITTHYDMNRFVDLGIFRINWGFLFTTGFLFLIFCLLAPMVGSCDKKDRYGI